MLIRKRFIKCGHVVYAPTKKSKLRTLKYIHTAANAANISPWGGLYTARLRNIIKMLCIFIITKAYLVNTLSEPDDLNLT